MGSFFHKLLVKSVLVNQPKISGIDSDFSYFWDSKFKRKVKKGRLILGVSNNVLIVGKNEVQQGYLMLRTLYSLLINPSKKNSVNSK